MGTAGTVTLTCTGAPTTATCSVPASIAVTASTASAFDVTVTTTARTTAALAHHRDFFYAAWLWSFGLIGWVSILGVGTRKRNQRLLMLLPMLLLVGALISCGGGGNPVTHGPTSGTPAATYTLTVAGQSGGVTQSTALTLVVQ